MGEDEVSARWSFLEREPDACAVVTRRMEVLYLNAAARSLVPTGWFGNRCWEVFPVGEEQACASRCPAVRAVSSAEDVSYCEENLYLGGGSPITLGVAVLPLGAGREDGERGLLVLRPKGADGREEIFRRELLDDSRELLARVRSRLGK